MPAHTPTFFTRIAAIVFCAAAVAAPAGAVEAPDETLSQGRELAGAFCSGCHAIGPDDASAHPDAPPFRTLGRLYPVESLQEALAEGIVTGHPDMPEVAWHPDTIEVFLTYLKSIQVP